MRNFGNFFKIDDYYFSRTAFIFRAEFKRHVLVLCFIIPIYPKRCSTSTYTTLDLPITYLLPTYYLPSG
jgi:hypothetical protein